MKIVFFAEGRTTHPEVWLRYFADRGHEVHLVTATGMRPIDPISSSYYKSIKGVTVHELKYFTRRHIFPLRLWEVKKKFKEIGPDIVHAHYVSGYGVYAALTRFHPLVLTAWGSDIAYEPEKSRIVKFLVKFALKEADLVQATDNIGRERLIELGCDRKKIFVQEWGVDTDRFSPKARSRSLRRSLGIDNMYSVISARWRKPPYHVDVLIKAIPLVLEKMRNVKFIFLGGGAYEPRLKELARRLGVYENTVFVGWIPHHEMHRYLASADVYVDASSDYHLKGIVRRGGGGMGQTTREVMACGTPQILPDTLSVRGGPWFRGLMYKQLDRRDLAEKIVQLLSDKKLGKEIGVESRRVVLEICDLKKVMKKWEAIYHRLANATTKRTNQSESSC